MILLISGQYIFLVRPENLMKSTSGSLRSNPAPFIFKNNVHFRSFSELKCFNTTKSGYFPLKDLSAGAEIPSAFILVPNLPTYTYKFILSKP